MTSYQAPQITGERSVIGRLEECCSVKPFSDAEIKHNVELIQSDYEAPEITDQRQLDGQLGEAKSERPDFN
jgi:hypothetical protein